MDRQTLAHYGWIVIAALILAVMLALATPFGKYVMDGVSSIASGYINASNKAMSEENKQELVAEWEDKWLGTVGNDNNEIHKNHSGKIPSRAIYLSQPETCPNGCCINISSSIGVTGETCGACGYAFTKGTKYTEGNAFPTPQRGDIYRYSQYEYCFGYDQLEFSIGTWGNYNGHQEGYHTTSGWGVYFVGGPITSAEPMLGVIAGQPIFKHIPHFLHFSLIAVA